MRGNPLIQWLVFVVVWMLLLIPIVKVTRLSTPAASLSDHTTAQSKPVWISVRFSDSPRSFSLAFNDADVWTVNQPTGRVFEREVSLPIDRYGVEMKFTAELPESETAVEIIMEPDGLNRRSRTLWVAGSVDEVLTFSWERP